VDVGVSASVSTGQDGQDIRRLYDRLDGPAGIQAKMSDTRAQIDKHEAVCAERYKRLDDQMWWVRWLLIALLMASMFEPRQIVSALLKQWGVEVSRADPGVAAGKAP
jgi:predicted anti-sigma-YlaC factor YlaD